MRRPLVIAVMLAALAGCLSHVGYEGVAPKSLKLKKNGAVSKDEAASIGRGHDLFLYMEERYCAQLKGDRISLRRYDGSIDLDASYEDKITALMCYESYESGRGRDSYVSVMHFRLGDRRVNHLDGAIALVLCTGEELCQRDGASAQLAWYAETTDREAVRKAIEQVNIPAEMRLAFLRRADAGARLILRRVGDLGKRERHLLRDIPFEVRKQRAAHWKKHAALWTRFDELVSRADATVRSGNGDSDLVYEISTLRDDYVQACVADGTRFDSCMHGQLARPLTEQLVRLAIAGKDPVLARAENAVLLSGADRSSAGVEIYIAQAAALKEENEQYAKMKKAQADGIDAATIRNRFGDPPPVKIYSRSLWEPRRSTINYRSLIDDLGATVAVRGHVERVKVRGKNAVIRFAGKFTRPVTVPAADARGIEKGHRVLAIVDNEESRTGYVATVELGKELIGLRMMR